MSNIKYLNTVRRWYEEMWSKPDFDIAEEIVAPDYDPSWVQIPAKGSEQVKHEIRYFRSIFPDLLYTIVDMVGSEHRVWVRYRATGTQDRNAWGFEPTNKRVAIEGVTIFDMNSKAQVSDRWSAYSFYDVLVDLELAPPLWELRKHLIWPNPSKTGEEAA